jgi:excisionase family DNA binding protein
MRISQVATYLNASVDTVTRLIRSGALPAIDTRAAGSSRAHFLVERSEVAAFEQRGKSK